MAIQANSDITNALTEIEKNLNKPLKALNEYVEYVKQIGLAKETLAKLENDKVELERMKVVLGKYRIKDDTAGSSQIQNIQSKIDNIAHTLTSRHTQLEECEERARQELEQNSENLVARIEEEKEKLNDHITKVQSESLMNRDTSASDALKELRQLKRRYDETLEKITMYQQYEETLAIEERVPVPQIEIFTKLFNKRQTLWQNREDFKRMQGAWYYDDFLKQDAEDIVKKVKDYANQNQTMKIKMGADEKDDVLEAFSSEVNAVVEHVGLITWLGNKAMRSRHWEKVYALT